MPYSESFLNVSIIIIETFRKEYEFVVSDLSGLEDENKKLRHDSDFQINILGNENDSLRETVDRVNHSILQITTTFNSSIWHRLKSIEQIFIS